MQGVLGVTCASYAPLVMFQSCDQNMLHANPSARRFCIALDFPIASARNNITRLYLFDVHV